MHDWRIRREGAVTPDKPVMIPWGHPIVCFLHFRAQCGIRRRHRLPGSHYGTGLGVWACMKDLEVALADQASLFEPARPTRTPLRGRALLSWARYFAPSAQCTEASRMVLSRPVLRASK